MEMNTFYTPDIVEPCALMAPYANGVPQLPFADGNRNSPPSGADASLATADPISPLSGILPDNSTQPDAASYVPASWGWNGRVGRVTITKIGE
jgi:hypothetical protein